MLPDVSLLITLQQTKLFYEKETKLGERVQLKNASINVTFRIKQSKDE